MNPRLELRAILLGRATAQGVVTEVGLGTALVVLPSGTQRVQADVSLVKGDIVTVRAGRVVSKRTGGAGGAIKVYQV